MVHRVYYTSYKYVRKNKHLCSVQQDVKNVKIIKCKTGSDIHIQLASQFQSLIISFYYSHVLLCLPLIICATCLLSRDTKDELPNIEEKHSFMLLNFPINVTFIHFIHINTFKLCSYMSLQSYMCCTGNA